jgi:two-component system, cell cycle response regulator DivK
MAYILLIEDNPDHALLTTRILQGVGYEVVHRERGFDGAQIARRDRPSLILMDFDLPDVNGRTLALILQKQLGGTDSPPIIAVTARAGEDEMRRAEQFGCSGFISKPFLPEDLLKMVARFVLPTSKTEDAN